MERGSLRSQHDLLITRLFGCRDLVVGHQCCGDEPDQGTIMAKHKKGSKIRSRAKLQRRAKLRRAISAKRSKAAKRTVAKAKPKPRPSKKAAHKETAAPTVETLIDTSEIREEGKPKPPSLI